MHMVEKMENIGITEAEIATASMTSILGLT